MSRYDQIQNELGILIADMIMGKDSMVNYAEKHKELTDQLREELYKTTPDYEREQTLFAARTSLENLLTFELSRDEKAQIADMITTIERMK